MTVLPGVKARIDGAQEYRPTTRIAVGSVGISGYSPLATRAWPAPLEDDAFNGPAGKFVRAVEPHSEADMAALLGQFLVAFGSAVGSRPHFMAESDRHGVNLNAVFVG